MTASRFPEFGFSLDRLRSLQLDRLRQSLAHAYANQAPYRAKCQAADVRPDDLKSLDDLRLFPFTAKSDLRDAWWTIVRNARDLSANGHDAAVRWARAGLGLDQ